MRNKSEAFVRRKERLQKVLETCDCAGRAFHLRAFSEVGRSVELRPGPSSQVGYLRERKRDSW